MIINTTRKIEICEKYDVYLKLIYFFGNKVILQKQLQQYAEALNMANPNVHFDFWEQMRQLEEAEIIKKDKFRVQGKKTNLQVLVLRKFAIMYLQKKANTQGVGAVGVNNERIMLSVFKNHYILNKLIPVLEKRNIKVNYANITKYIEDTNSDLLLNKNKGLEALLIFKNSIAEKYIDKDQYAGIYERILKVETARSIAFAQGSKTKRGKGKGNERSVLETPLEMLMSREKKPEKPKGEEILEVKKAKYLEEYTFNTMLNNYMYIANAKLVDNVYKITILYYNISNNQKLLEFAKYITGIYRIYSRALNVKIEMKVGYVSFDKISESNLTKEAIGYKMRNVQTKEKYDTQCLQLYLQQNFVLIGLTWSKEQLAVEFTNYDITNNYLDGIKYANILKTEGAKPVKNVAETVKKSNKTKAKDTKGEPKEDKKVEIYVKTEPIEPKKVELSATIEHKIEGKKLEPVARVSTLELKLKKELDEERQIQEVRWKQLKELESNDEY